MNKIAPKGAIYVCGACGKRSRDQYGDQKIDGGWDESCTMKAVLCKEDSYEILENGSVKADPWEGE